MGNNNTYSYSNGIARNDPPNKISIDDDNLQNHKDVMATSSSSSSIVHRIVHKFQKALEEKTEKDESIPEKYKNRVPFWFKEIVLFLAWLSFSFILIYFTYVGYLQDQTTKYISLDPTIYTQDKTSPYRQCNDVSNAISGVFTLDKNGYWSGMSNYLGGYGKYKFEFFNFQHSYSEYYNFMSDVKTKIATIGSSAITRTSAQNLAYLMSWTYVWSDGYDQRITFVGDPVYVFNRFYKTASMGSTSYPCKAIPSIALDKGTGIFTVQYVYGTPTNYTNNICSNEGTGYVSSAIEINGCGGNGCCLYFNESNKDNDYNQFSEKWCVIPPGDFGYLEAFDAAHFTMKYNIWSLMTAYAVNQGILDFSVLEEVEIGLTNNIFGCFSLNSKCVNDARNGASKCSASSYELSYDSSNKRCSVLHPTTKARYYVTARVDPRYPGMDAIICMMKVGDTVPSVCLLRMGDAFVYPYFNHMGTSNDGDFYSWKSNCVCKAPSIPTKFSNFYDSTMFAINSTTGKFKGQSDGYCDQFDLIHGFVVFKSNHYEEHLMYNIILASEFTASQIDTMAYYAGFSQLRLGGNAAQNPQSGTTTATDLLNKMMPGKGGDNALSFCSGLPGITGNPTSCSIFAMNTYDEFDTRINKDGVIAPFTSCVNNFDIDDTAWDSGSYDDDDDFGPTAGDGALRLPPARLIQKYYECYNTKYSSLMFAFGSASGSAGTIEPFFIAIFVIIALKFVIKKKEEKEKEEPQDSRIREIQMRAKFTSSEI